MVGNGASVGTCWTSVAIGAPEGQTISVQCSLCIASPPPRLTSCSLQIKQHSSSFLLSSLCNLPSCSLIFAHCVSSFLKLFALCLLALLAAWCCDLASGERPPMQMAGCQRLVNVKEGEGRSKIVEWYLLRFASNYIHDKIMLGRWHWQSKKDGRTIHKTMRIIAKNGSF